MMKLTWDYNYQEYSNVFGLQKDWNQTLITKINQMSAMIFQKTHRGGANKIKINSVLLPLFHDLEYFNIDDYNEMFLAGRYRITIDDSLPKNIVLLSYETQDMIDLESKGFVYYSVKHGEELSIGVFKLDSEEYTNALNDPNFFILNKDNCKGEIEILNYE
jgi:phage pi2 protein 07